ncbi:hypothetical protein [Megalodesulfovibrio gigas]|uniref:hypothetical protein n=1 Tax=Megalodesulfovibrio gigas TaxID=879 RepID=UPI001186CB3E|nr:hypothetical protein [Megalodesulfovibrio gigas]
MHVLIVLPRRVKPLPHAALLSAGSRLCAISRGKGGRGLMTPPSPYSSRASYTSSWPYIWLGE